MTFATTLAASIAMVFTAVGSGLPPTDGVTASCSVGDQSVVSGFKGNPTRVDFIWRNATDGYQSNSADLDVGGKFGNVATATTPASGNDPVTGATKTPWTPESLTVSVIYKDTVAFHGTVDCA
jgi:hypothetical protein